MQKASYNLISYETGLDIKTSWEIMKKVFAILVLNYYNIESKLVGKTS